MGVCTNNQAEYSALLAALDIAANLETDMVTCHLDSELVAKQLNGEYRIKNRELKKLWQRVQEKKKQFTKVEFIFVPRSHPTIQEVDKLVNSALDARNEKRTS